MRILVTGGAGFIGSAVVRRAVAEGHEVVNLDALTYAGSLSNVEDVAASPLYAFEHADIRDRAALDRIFATHRPDAVMHLAAESHVDRSIDGPRDFMDTNVTGTLNVLVPEAEGQKWFELHPKDGFFVPQGTAHQYRNVGAGPVEFLFGIAPDFLPEGK